MAIRDILIAPDKRLRQISEPVGIVTPALRNLMDDMLKTMYAAQGIGLAAIQIGIPQRIIVIDCQRDQDIPAQPFCLIDPEIIWCADTFSEYDEGCLSLPDYYESVSRPERCRVRFIDYEGERQEWDCNGILATCVQHEIDHLNGRLFVDHISRLKRDTILKKLAKARKLEVMA